MFDKCVLCGGDLKQIVDIPPVLMKCEECYFVQAKTFYDVDYTKYNEPTSDKKSEQLLAIVNKAQNCGDLRLGCRVLDIGCADGSLLGWYVKGINTVGVDPSVNLVKEGLVKHRIDLAITDTFSANAIVEMFNTLKVKNVDFEIITAINVIHLVSNPQSFINDVAKLLSLTGVFVVQVPYLATTIAEKRVDRISKDTFGYFLTTPLQNAINRAGLEFQGVELQPEGTIRGYATHKQPKDNETFLASDPSRRSFLWSNSQMKILEECRFGFYGEELYKKFEGSVKSGDMVRG
jgi:SAM-dependent methyltransferase